VNKYVRLGKNTLTVFVGNAGAKLISFLMLPFYTRWLSVEEYGTIDIINVYVTLLLGLVTASIVEAVFIFPKGQPNEQQKSYFSSGLCFSFCSLLITALLFKIFFFVLSYKKIYNSFTEYVWYIYGVLVASFLQQYTQQFVRSIDKMKIYSTTGIVLTISTAVFSFLLIPKWGVFGYVFALILANASAAFYAFVFSGAFRYFSIKTVRKVVCIEMLKFSIPLIPNGVMWWLVGAINRPIMEQFLGLHAIGIFALANKFPGIISIVFSIFAVSWQISVIEEFGKEGYGIFYNRVFRFVVSGLVLMFLIITIASQFIVRIIATEQFYGAWKYIPVLTMGAVLSSISGFAGSTFSASRESKYFFYSSVWGAVSSLVFNFILIPRIGIMGAALSVVISFAVMVMTRLMYSWKYVKIYKDRLMYVLMALVSIAAIFSVLYMNNLIKYLFLVGLLVLFVFINYGLKEDFSRLYKSIKRRTRTIL
jgi:O-antigen/teichoic acid export membrane protein